MKEISTINGVVKIFAKTIEDEAITQVRQFASSPLGENAHIRIMPDAHVGAGCVIGTTMRITDKVCPNIVGVDIGCGVDVVKTDINLAKRLPELDAVIRKKIPFGKEVHDKPQGYRELSRLRCWKQLGGRTTETAIRALGSLGGGNHFIEAYDDGYLAVHSGSRGIGFRVALHYQNIAERNARNKTIDVSAIPPTEREAFIKQNRDLPVIDRELAYLTGDLMADYLHDMKIMQEFAVANRRAMLDAIANAMDGKIESRITSTHNYIDLESMILRKGATSAQKDEELVIPLNMRDGLLVCVGKGNPDWNFSAPHGAGRLYSRRRAKEVLTLHDYQKSMAGIFSTCICGDTLDEAPMAYKDWNEICDCIGPTVEIVKRLTPIYNFKASE